MEHLIQTSSAYVPMESPSEYSHDNHDNGLKASSLLTQKVALLTDEFDLYVQNLPRDIGWHIHPYDGSNNNIIYDACGWHFAPPSSRIFSNTTDSSLNWFYYHHGHVVDISMTDISGITTKYPTDFIPDVTIPNLPKSIFSSFP
jgi:hypothetical protein